jgi:hypothetical protein
MEEAVLKFIVIPVLFLIGILITGGIIQDSFHIPGAAVMLFQVAGGVGGLGLYFKTCLS